MNIKQLEKEQCTACMACEKVCPTGAIVQEQNEDGFLYPIIKDGCIDCGKCVSVCQICSKANKKDSHEQNIYLAISKDRKNRKRSSSGGLFFALAENVIAKNGIVYGAKIVNGIHVIHDRADSLNKLKAMQGSKYIQSDLKDVYKKVKQDLLHGRVVLFSGTPCQVNGLYNFLQKDYKKLITIDLICKGVASGKVLDLELSNAAKYKNQDEIENLSFRAKTWNHKTSYALNFGYHKKRWRIKQRKSFFYESYLKELSFRKSCYSCNYTTMERVGDLTLGDCNTADYYFWFYPGQAANLVLLNSNKGKRLFHELEDRISYREINTEREHYKNLPLYKASTKKEERNEFYKDLKLKDYTALQNIYIEPQSITEKTKELIADIFPKSVKAILKGIFLHVVK